MKSSRQRAEPAERSRRRQRRGVMETKRNELVGRVLGRADVASADSAVSARESFLPLTQRRVRAASKYRWRTRLNERAPAKDPGMNQAATMNRTETFFASADEWRHHTR